MNKSLLAAAILSLAGLPLIATAGPSAYTKSLPAMPSLNSVDAAAVVLYDQSANPSGFGTSSQNFEASFDAYDDQAADDFTVPAGKTWQIQEIDFQGFYNGAGGSKAQNVTLYKDASGKPGAVVGTAALKCTDSSGSFACKAPKAVSLKAGKYWVSIQPNLTFATGGQWYWANQSTVEGSGAVWKNPGDGFGSGCTAYGPESTCIAGNTGDQVFVVKGLTN